MDFVLVDNRVVIPIYCYYWYLLHIIGRSLLFLLISFNPLAANAVVNDRTGDFVQPCERFLSYRDKIQARVTLYSLVRKNVRLEDVFNAKIFIKTLSRWLQAPEASKKLVLKNLF